MLADTKKTRERIVTCTPFLRIIREMYPGLITKMHKDPKTELERYYNIELYHKCQIAIKLPIHKRLAKEKFRKTYEINEMLDHLFDLFQLIGKKLASANFPSVTKGCQKTIAKFSKKLKNMIKHKGDFYLPKSNSGSKERSEINETSFSQPRKQSILTHTTDQNETITNEINIQSSNAEEVKAIPQNIFNLSPLPEQERVLYTQPTFSQDVSIEEKPKSPKEIDFNKLLQEYKDKYGHKVQKMQQGFREEIQQKDRVIEEMGFKLKEKDIAMETRVAEVAEDYETRMVELFNRLQQYSKDRVIF